jgi:hypothetical protein
MMSKAKSVVDSKSQSARFIEAAEKTGADETGKKFERALKRITRKAKQQKK